MCRSKNRSGPPARDSMRLILARTRARGLSARHAKDSSAPEVSPRFLPRPSSTSSRYAPIHLRRRKWSVDGSCSSPWPESFPKCLRDSVCRQPTMSTLTYGPRAVYPTQPATRDLEQGEKAHPTAQRIDRHERPCLHRGAKAPDPTTRKGQDLTRARCGVHT